MSCPSSFLMDLPRAEMEIVDLSEPFATDDDFGDNDFGDSHDEAWESQSFLHQRKRTQGTAAKRVQPKIESTVDWEISQESKEPIEEMDVLLDDLGDKKATTSVPSTPNELGVFAKKLESLNRKIPLGAIKTASQVTAAMTPEGIPVDRFEAGDMVLHPSYGPGTITSVEGRGVRRMARVVFLEGDAKSFQLSKAHLTFTE